MKRVLFSALVLLLACSGPTPNHGTTGTFQDPLGVCKPGDPTEEAKKPSGFDEKEGILPTGRRITPVGMVIHLDKWAFTPVFSPDGKYLYVGHNGRKKIDVINVDTGEVVGEMPYEIFRGIAISKDGQVMYLADAGRSRVRRCVPDEEKAGLFKCEQDVLLPGFLADLGLSEDGSTLYVMSNTNSKVWKLDAQTLEKKGEMEADLFPYDLIVVPGRDAVFVSNAAGSTIELLDFSTGKKTEVSGVKDSCRNPMGMVLWDKYLFVACSDSDTVLKIDTEAMKVDKVLDTIEDLGVPPGASPNEIAISPDGSRLYVSESQLNLVLVVDPITMKVLGKFPTGYYATGIAVDGAGEFIAVCSSKGMGAFGNSPHSFKGLVSIVAVDDLEDNLGQWTLQADANYKRLGEFFPTNCSYPLPVEDKVIKHVVLIVRENKTYDCDLGDFERGNGDPNLVVFGKKYTPNLHALAEQFVNLDNYYADSEESTQGHNWTTQAACNDLYEKVKPSQFLLVGIDPAIIKNNYTIFDNCLDNGVTFRNYGEWEGFSRDLFGKFRPYIDRKFPFFDLAISDVVKAKEFIREFKLGIFPQFVYIALPNDHTMGTKPNHPTPQWYVADNDYATGLIVEAISHSEYWKETAIFIIEDDPQGYGGDHVNPNRSICVVVSPWVKHKYTSSVHYDIPSLYKTIEMLLGLPPMNLNDAMAVPMYDIWASAPDMTPYDAIKPDVPYEENTPESFAAHISEKMDFSQPDRAPGLGWIIWHAVKGADVEPPPYAKWNDK